MERTAYGATAVSSEKWYYLKGGKKQGPIDGTKLSSMLAAGSLPPETRVWTNGMDNWAPASDTQLMSQAASSSVVSLHTPQQAEPKRKSKGWIWVIVILLLGAVAAAAYFLFFNGNNTAKPQEEEVKYKLKESVVFENDECAFIIDDIGEKGQYLELDVRCVNKTEEILTFTWNSTSINGIMFDPMWNVTVLGGSTQQSSITFPLDKLTSQNLLPADQIKFILQVCKEYVDNDLAVQSAAYIVPMDMAADYEGYQPVEGYNGYLFAPNVQLDKQGRPYYLAADETKVYFDEIYDLNGKPRYPVVPEEQEYTYFYDDEFGRPYYFDDNGEVVYYDGFGFAFYDKKTNKYYYFDEEGKPAYYGNKGVAEYYEGKVSQAVLNVGKSDKLVSAGGSNVVHKEFALYPTGKTADKIERPERTTSTSEQIYWDGEKGNFLILGGEMDDFTGYIVHAYVENNSNSYILLGWTDVVVNGVEINPESLSVLRPHSGAYVDIVIPAAFLKENKIKAVERIDFRVVAVGENLSVPLYPIQWTAVDMVTNKK